jgi:hypothetical protein
MSATRADIRTADLLPRLRQVENALADAQARLPALTAEVRAIHRALAHAVTAASAEGSPERQQR